MRVLFVIVLGLVCIQSSLQSQSPGIVIQTGLSIAHSKDPNITKSGQGHYGYVIGADARILEGGMYFIVGGQYHSTTLASTEKSEFFGTHNWKILMGRMGLGFNVFQINEKLAIRSKLLLSINFNMDTPKESLNVVGYETVNDSYLGATTGLGITIGIFDLDLEYQYGILNAYNKQSISTVDSWALVAGIHF